MRVTEAGCRCAGSCLLLAVALSRSSSVASAGPGVWTTGGPYGGHFRALAIDPTTPATLYAGTALGRGRVIGSLFRHPPTLGFAFSSLSP